MNKMKKWKTLGSLDVGQLCKGVEQYYKKVTIDDQLRGSLSLAPDTYSFLLQLSDNKVVVFPSNTICLPVRYVPKAKKETIQQSTAPTVNQIRYVVANYYEPNDIRYTLIQDPNMAMCFLNLDAKYKTAFYTSREDARETKFVKSSIWKVLVDTEAKRIVKWLQKNP